MKYIVLSFLISSALYASDDPVDTSKPVPPEELLTSIIYQVRSLRREHPSNHNLPRSEKYLKKALQAYKKEKRREESSEGR